MKAFIFLIILTTFPAFSAVRNGLEVKLPKTWTEVPPKVMPVEGSFMYAPKEKSKAIVIHQQVEFRPVFPDLNKEMVHQCRIYQAEPGELVEFKSSKICLFKKTDSALVLSSKKDKRFINAFSFRNMSADEIKTFLNLVGVK